MFSACLSHQIRLAFSDFKRIDTTYASSFMVHGKHDTGSLGLRFPEMLAQYVYYEIHGGEIVVE